MNQASLAVKPNVLYVLHISQGTAVFCFFSTACAIYRINSISYITKLYLTLQNLQGLHVFGGPLSHIFCAFYEDQLLSTRSQIQRGLTNVDKTNLEAGRAESSTGFVSRDLITLNPPFIYFLNFCWWTGWVTSKYHEWHELKVKKGKLPDIVG